MNKKPKPETKPETNQEQDLWCEYSDLPSPKAYINCADYDSMGNHGRFPKMKKTQKITDKIKLIFSKIKRK